MSCVLYHDASSTAIYPLSLHERSSDLLLQAATRRETAEIDRREAETLDELFDECGRFGMVPRDEDHATPSVLHRPFIEDRKSTRLNSSHTVISYAVFCLKKKKKHSKIT